MCGCGDGGDESAGCPCSFLWWEVAVSGLTMLTLTEFIEGCYFSIMYADEGG